MAKKTIKESLANEEMFFVVDSNGVFGMKGDTIVGAINESDIIQEIQAGLPISTGFLPKNCYYLDRKGDNTQIILEYPPGLKPVKYISREVSSDKFEGKIFYPYLYVLLELDTIAGSKNLRLNDGGYVFSRTTRLTSLSDKMYRVHLPNLYTDGRICWGQQKMSADKNSLSNFVDTAMDGFWQSNCNGDLGLYLPKFVTSGGRRFGQLLEEMSKTPIEKFLDQKEYHEIGSLSDFIGQGSGF